MLDKTQHSQLPRREPGLVHRPSGRAAGGLAAGPSLIQGRFLATRSYKHSISLSSRATWVLEMHATKSLASHLSHLTHLKSRSVGILARKHFLISKMPNLLSLVV